MFDIVIRNGHFLMYANFINRSFNYSIFIFPFLHEKFYFFHASQIKNVRPTADSCHWLHITL